MQPSVDATSSKGRQRPACEECRRRKLRCDGQQPQCSVCKETGVVCEVSPIRAPRGPKRGYLKNLRNRVFMLENKMAAQEQSFPIDSADFGSDDLLPSPLVPGTNTMQSFRQQDSVHEIFSMMEPAGSELEINLSPPTLDLSTLRRPTFVTEPPPTPATSCLTSGAMLICDLTQAELDQLYFDRVHPSLPILQQRRYCSWSKQSVKTSARLCLQYSMWTMASLLSGQFQHLQDGFYQEARQMLDTSNQSITASGILAGVELAQAWVLIATYESMKTQHQQSWMSAGHAFRIAQLMKLHQVDNPSAKAKAIETDSIATEERRRVFWMAAAQIYTRLPAPDLDFQAGQIPTTDFLSDAVVDGNLTARSPFNECIILATICGRTLFHNQQYNTRCLHGDTEPDWADWNGLE